MRPPRFSRRSRRTCPGRRSRNPSATPWRRSARRGWSRPAEIRTAYAGDLDRSGIKAIDVLHRISWRVDRRVDGKDIPRRRGQSLLRIEALKQEGHSMLGASRPCRPGASRVAGKGTGLRRHHGRRAPRSHFRCRRKARGRDPRWHARRPWPSAPSRSITARRCRRSRPRSSPGTCSSKAGRFAEAQEFYEETLQHTPRPHAHARAARQRGKATGPRNAFGGSPVASFGRSGKACDVSRSLIYNKRSGPVSGAGHVEAGSRKTDVDCRKCKALGGPVLVAERCSRSTRATGPCLLPVFSRALAERLSFAPSRATSVDTIAMRLTSELLSAGRAPAPNDIKKRG